MMGSCPWNYALETATCPKYSLTVTKSKSYVTVRYWEVAQELLIPSGMIGDAIAIVRFRRLSDVMHAMSPNSEASV